MEYNVKRFEFEIDFEDLEEDDVIQVLLAEGKISIYPNKAEEWVVAANANDVFYWNLPQSVDIPPEELLPVFDYWMKDPEYGVKVWCIVRQGMMPQSRLAQRLKERGIWDLSIYELAPNSYETSASWQ